VDVANGTFWRAQDLSRAVQQVFNCNLPQIQAKFKDAASSRDSWKTSAFREDCARFKRVGVTAFHIKDKLSQWTIEEFYHKDVHGATFSDPDDHSTTNAKARRKISVYQYFKSKYNLQPTAGIPVVKMTKKIRGGDVYIPMGKSWTMNIYGQVDMS
jgi:eukaryotic translation initiation factor 2C